MNKLNLPASSIRWAFNFCDWSPTLEQWKYCTQCVPDYEVVRCNRFVYAEDCKSCMVGQLLMRKAVRISTGMDYDKITFSRSDFGKPFLAGEHKDKIHFNISHNGDFCVLAAEKHFNVGVDVMKTRIRGERKIEDFINTLHHQFSIPEWNYVMGPELPEEQLKRFFRLWCLKESYVKAKGTGIRFGLKRLSFSCPTPTIKQDEIVSDSTLTLDDTPLTDWKFEEMLLNANHSTAVALGPISSEFKPMEYESKNFTILTYEELMKDCMPIHNPQLPAYYDLFRKRSRTAM